MRVLIAEDDAVSSKLLQTLLAEWNYEVIVTENGEDAWEVLKQDDGPSLAILDWLMPGLDGPQVCRKVRGNQLNRMMYLILLTRLGKKDYIVKGLEAGADDYLAKPFHPAELRARVQSGERVVRLERELRERVVELEDALGKVKQLQGLIPICSWCKKIRDDQDYWHQVDAYVAKHADVQFSHGICPTCYEEVMKPQIEQAKSDNDEK
ncbi:MAG: response regulator transcription factor [Gemmatimonadetes bacterium]|nr:response regulator transcription factor [Gemmatimonadota bacterium]